MNKKFLLIEKLINLQLITETEVNCIIKLAKTHFKVFFGCIVIYNQPQIN